MTFNIYYKAAPQMHVKQHFHYFFQEETGMPSTRISLLQVKN